MRLRCEVRKAVVFFSLTHFFCFIPLTSTSSSVNLPKMASRDGGGAGGGGGGCLGIEINAYICGLQTKGSHDSRTYVSGVVGQE